MTNTRLQGASLSAIDTISQAKIDICYHRVLLTIRYRSKSDNYQMACLPAWDYDSEIF